MFRRPRVPRRQRRTIENEVVPASETRNVPYNNNANIRDQITQILEPLYTDMNIPWSPLPIPGDEFGDGQTVPISMSSLSSIVYEVDDQEFLPVTSDASTIQSSIISDEQVDESCQPQDEQVSQDFKWMMKNCGSCRSNITLENYDQKDAQDVVAINVYNTTTGKFGRGQCVLKSELKSLLKSDIGEDRPSYFFSLYTKRNNSSSLSGDSERGLGTSPNDKLVVQLNAANVSIFVTLRSVFKLFQTQSRDWYALPLFGGKRRRVGNIEGNLMLVGAHHGQIPGYVIYKLYTKDEFQQGITAEVEEKDFQIDILVCKNMEELLHMFRDKDSIRTMVLDNIINHVTH
jgi:hypothetical protein